MALSLLSAAEQVAGESGFQVPTTVVGSTDGSAQYQYLANASVRTLRQYEWQKLRKTGSITLTSATEYSLASDFWSIVPDTLWPYSAGRPADMPVTTSRWAQLKAMIGISSIAFNCRFLNNKLHVQNPQAGYVLNYEYVSKNAVETSLGVARETFAADTDVCVLDDELFVRDLKWRWKKEKGIDDWEVDLADFKQYLHYRQGVDAGAQVITSAKNVVFPEPYTNLWVS